MVEEAVDTHTKTKKKRGKPEDFVGWVSPDGNLKVVELIEKSKHSRYKITCDICLQDPELFPDGYFISTRGDLLRGSIPCGCSKRTNWKNWQYLILAKRAGEGRFVVHGFAEEFHGHKTKLNLECIKDGYKWVTSIDKIINDANGCAKCRDLTLSEQRKTPQYVALQKCTQLCEEMNYEFIGFNGEYKGAFKTNVEYVCPKHGKKKTTYNNFVNHGRRCPDCWKERLKTLSRENGNGNGYYPERKDEQDFLYVLNFNNQFIKLGRSFDVGGRIDNLKVPSVSGIKNIIKLRIFTATHQEVYDYEQFLLNSLRPNFQHYCGWSTETLINAALTTLNTFLDSCNLEEIDIDTQI